MNVLLVVMLAFNLFIPIVYRPGIDVSIRTFACDQQVGFVPVEVRPYPGEDVYTGRTKRNAPLVKTISPDSESVVVTFGGIYTNTVAIDSGTSFIAIDQNVSCVTPK